MSTAAQVLANRENAQHSTGPKSDEGKAASSRNALSHGLSSAATVLAHENQQEFDALLKTLRDEHQPANQHQRFLVDQLGRSQWLLARAQRLETVAFDLLAGNFGEDSQNEPDRVIVQRLLDAGRDPLTLFQRYAANAERSYHKTWRELKEAKRVQNESAMTALRYRLQPTPPRMNMVKNRVVGRDSRIGYWCQARKRN